MARRKEASRLSWKGSGCMPHAEAVRRWEADGVRSEFVGRGELTVTGECRAVPRRAVPRRAVSRHVAPWGRAVQCGACMLRCMRVHMCVRMPAYVRAHIHDACVAATVEAAHYDSAASRLWLALDRSPFYPAGGGQIGDSGRLRLPDDQGV